jgi:hypothetical protein
MTENPNHLYLHNRVLLVDFFDAQGIVHYKFIPERYTVTMLGRAAVTTAVCIFRLWTEGHTPAMEHSYECTEKQLWAADKG